jgi:methanogenic corrinoid protein MtbC1
MNDQPLSATTTVSSGPSLYKLVNALPQENRVVLPADALIIIGRQLEAAVLDNGLPADVAIGVMRFSLFRLHQGRIMQLAAYCRSITVFGEADVEPPTIPGITFVALEPGTPLCYEWFLIVDSSEFWGALLTQAVPERRDGNLRRYLFEGALTSDERVVSRTSLILSLVLRRNLPPVTNRDPMTNRAYWALIVSTLAGHSENERLKLTSSLGEFPELAALYNRRGAPLNQLLDASLEAMYQYSLGSMIYRYEGDRLHPQSWRGVQPPPTLQLQSVAGQAVLQRTRIVTPLMPHQPEHVLLPRARAVIALPLMVDGQPWGVLVSGQPSHDPQNAPGVVSVIGVGTVLQQLLNDHFTSDVDPLASMMLDSWPEVSAPPSTLTNGVSRSSNGQSAAPNSANGQNAAFTAPGLPAPPKSVAAAPVVPQARPAAPAAPPTAAYEPSGGQPNTNGTTRATLGLPSWMRGMGASTVTPGLVEAQQAERRRDHTWSMLQKRLMGALVAFDQRSAEYVWTEACSLYSPEAVCIDLLLPVQIGIGEGWHRGEVTVAAEHFASRFVQGKLLNLLSVQPVGLTGPQAVIGCAQGELHELGALVLALFMRWSGFRVIYLGQNVPNSTIEETVLQLRPQILGLSATTVAGARTMIEVGEIVARIDPPRPLFIFGGIAFYEQPELVQQINGRYLEGDVRQIVRELADDFRNGTRS